ncbi:MAG: hypothetical protein AVDCRST_MAG22-1373, partial [uncultured Rubrobacteraceae bacterium]
DLLERGPRDSGRPRRPHGAGARNRLRLPRRRRRHPDTALGFRRHRATAGDGRRPPARGGRPDGVDRFQHRGLRGPDGARPQTRGLRRGERHVGAGRGNVDGPDGPAARVPLLAGARPVRHGALALQAGDRRARQGLLSGREHSRGGGQARGPAGRAAALDRAPRDDPRPAVRGLPLAAPPPGLAAGEPHRPALRASRNEGGGAATLDQPQDGGAVDGARDEPRAARLLRPDAGGDERDRGLLGLRDAQRRQEPRAPLRAPQGQDGPQPGPPPALRDGRLPPDRHGREAGAVPPRRTLRRRRRQPPGHGGPQPRLEWSREPPDARGGARPRALDDEDGKAL